MDEQVVRTHVRTHVLEPKSPTGGRMKLEDRILQYLPLLASVPTAWMVGAAVDGVMHLPVPVAVVSALATEGMGFVAINTAIQMRDFNQHLSATEKKFIAPVGQAYLATGLYTLTVLVMTVLLHVFPLLVTYAPVPFVLMAVAGAWLYSLRADFSVKVTEREQGRAKARSARKSATVSDAGSDGQRRSATLKSRSATKEATVSDVPAKVYRCECGWSSVNRYEYSGHAGTCATRKAIKSQGIPVELPVRVEKQG